MPIEDQFRGNLDRVRGLVALYDAVAGVAPGRPSFQEADILRAAVVLLHASLEDLLRGVAASRLPHASKDILGQIPYAGGDGRKTTLTLGDLAAYRGRPVADVIADSVEAHLGRSSYNSPNEVAKLLVDVGLPASLIAPFAPRLQAMMLRRHHIAHRLDRNEAPGRGHHQARSISKGVVDRWVRAVDGLSAAILGGLRSEVPTGGKGPANA